MMTESITPSRSALIDGPFAQWRRWTDGDALHIDVRGLAPPGPMVAIIELLESIENYAPVIVHHERDPTMLYPELSELGWTAARIDGEPGEVRLKLERARKVGSDSNFGRGRAP
jgi:hypothetical protein